MTHGLQCHRFELELITYSNVASMSAHIHYSRLFFFFSTFLFYILEAKSLPKKIFSQTKTSLKHFTSVSVCLEKDQ